MSAVESKGDDAVLQSVQQPALQSTAAAGGVDVGAYLQQAADNQDVELNAPRLASGIDVNAIVQQAKKIAGLDMLVSFIQMLGVCVTDRKRVGSGKSG